MMVVQLPFLAVLLFLVLSSPELVSVAGQRALSQNSGGTGKDLKEYCELDTFRADCGVDQVILVTEAKYGMFRLGRCVQTDYGYVGCYADVRDYLNSRCAGRRRCEQRQPDPVLNQAVAKAQCPKEFKAYLYIGYICVNDEKQSCKSCPKPGRAKLTQPSGYISSIVAAETQNDGSCGSTRCPWVIVVLPGQVINVTLLGSNVTRSAGEPCVKYASIRERANPKESFLCGGGKGEETVYTSVSNVIEVYVVNQDVFNWKHQFLIHYEAIGCPDIVPPKAASVTRINHQLEVDCPLTGDRWNLVCVGASWQGHLGPCGSDPDPQVGAVSQHRTATSSFLSVVPIGVLIAAIVAFLIIVTVLVSTVGLVCYKKQQYKKRYRRSVVIPPTQLIDFGDDSSTVDPSSFIQKGVFPTLVFKSGPGGGGGGGGAAILAGGGGGGGDPVPGRENRYSAGKMDARPLPSIPDLRLSGSWKMVAADPGSVAAIQRMSSSGRGGGGGSSSGQTRMLIRSVVGVPDGFLLHRRSGSGAAAGGASVFASAGPPYPRPGSTCTVYSQADQHQYFILEPEEEEPPAPPTGTGTGRDFREMILLQERRQTVPRSYYHHQAALIRSGDELEVVGVQDGDIMVTSIHEIPMRSPAAALGVSTGPIIRVA